MARVTDQRDERIEELEAQIALLHEQMERTRYAQDLLYSMTLACRGNHAFRDIFPAIYHELRAIFPIDSGLIAVCNPNRPGQFRAALTVDAGQMTYAEYVDQNALIGRLVRQHAPLLFQDLLNAPPPNTELPPDETAGSGGQAVRSWLGVPLMLGADAIGAIVLKSYQAGRYDGLDRELLQRLGNIVAVALENVRLARHQHELSAALATRAADRSQELTMLNTLAAELVLEHPLPVLLDRALALLTGLLNIQGGSVRLLEPPGAVPIDPWQHELVLVAQRGLPEELIEPITRIAVAEIPLGQVISENRPLVINRGSEDVPTGDFCPPFAALLGVPLRIGNRILGTLSLVDTEPQAFDQDQIDLAQAIAHQIAIIVENARLFSERERQIAELQAINRISHAAGTALDLPSLLHKVYVALQRFMPLDAFSMIVYAPENGLVIEGISIDEGQEYTYLRNQPLPGNSFAAWLVRHRRPLHLRDVAAELPNYPELALHIVGANKPAAAWLGVPLFDRDAQVIGTIAIQGYEPHAFEPRDEDFLVSVAYQVALHVENVRLLAQRGRQIRELHAIGRLGQLVSASYDLNDILREIHTIIAAATDASVFYLIICEPRSQIITHAVFIEQNEPTDIAWQGRPPPADSLTAWILNQRRPLRFYDLLSQTTELQALGITPHSFNDKHPARAWVGMPLLAKDGEAIGVLSLQDYQPHRYDEQTVEFLRRLGSHVSLAVQKVRLFEDRERQVDENARLFAEARTHAAAAERQAHLMELVYRIASVLSSRLDQQEILDLAARELVRLFWADHTGTVLFDEDMQFGTVVAEYPPRDALEIRIPLKNNLLIEELVTTRRPVCITTTENDPRAHVSRETFRQLGIVSIIIVPLISRGRVIGSISLDSFRPRIFTAAEQELFLTVAASIATSIENARLFAAEQEHADASERHAQRMTLVNRIALVLSSHLDLQEILDLAVHEVVNLFGSDHTEIVLFDDDETWGTIVAEYPDQGTRGMRVPVAGTPIEQEIVTTRRPVCIPIVAGDPRIATVREELLRRGLVSMMIVPLVSRGQVIGSIGLDSLSEPREFSPDEQELLLTVAAAIAAAVQNARLFAAEQEARRTADTLREVARVLSSSFDPAEVLQLILRELQHVVRYDTASIMLREGSMLRLAAFRGNAEMLKRPERTLFNLDHQRADGMVLRRREPLMIADTSQSPDWFYADESPHVRSWLGVPLLTRGEVLGVLNINATNPNRFTPRDMEAALAFASQAAVALENARLYQESVTRVEQELNIARRIQSNLFPRSLPQLAGLALDARCMPARETGGDFYDVIALSGQRVGIIVGDVSGKSIPAAMLMAVARSITRSEARNHEIPQLVMCETNRWIVRDVPRRTFVALSYATLDLECRRLALSNAGQLTPLRRRADGRIDYLEAPGPRLPLGTMPDIAYDALEVTLDPGDLLVFYTDGIVEAHNDQHDLFGFERLEALLREYGNLPPAPFIDRLMQAVAAFTGGTAQHDDITLVVARV